MNCDQCRQAIEENFAIGGTGVLLPVWCERHLENCEDCRAVMEAELELNRLLEEPLPLPPAELSERVMEAISREPEPSLPFGERLLWAAAGGGCVAAFQYVKTDALLQMFAYEVNFRLPTFDFGVLEVGPALLPAAVLLTCLQVITVVWVRKRALA